MKHATSWFMMATAAGHTALASPTCLYNPVDLQGYGAFSGTTIDKTLTGKPLPEIVDAWLGMDYSTKPVGENRFKPVGWPEPFEGVRPAHAFGKACPQAPTTAVPLEAQDEDCLNFNVYRTRGVPLDQKLPVLVWVHGGRFHTGSSTAFDGASFAANSPEPMVVVNFQYRLGPLGSFPSALFEEEGLLNLGIRDQRQLLEFVQKHIGAFGGDAGAVTLGGLSAGAHAVGIHHHGNYGESEGERLFSAIIYESGSVTSRAFPNATYPLYQTQADEFLAGIGCKDALAKGNEAALACLRSADLSKIRDTGVAILNKYNPAVTWPFQPVSGGTLFEKPGSQSGIDGTFFHVPVITTTANDEGKAFVPVNLETEKEFIDFLSNGSPALTSEELDLISSLYPDPATNPDSPYANSPNSTQFNRIAAAWGDYAYICPGQENAYRSSLAQLPTWKLRWNTGNNLPDWRGVPHATDMTYVWAEPTVQYPEMGKVYHAYLASFVLKHDPNALRLDGSPEWPAYKVEGGEDEGSKGCEAEEEGSAVPMQLVVNPDGAQVEEDNIRSEQCQFWRDPSRAPRLNK